MKKLLLLALALICLGSNVDAKRLYVKMTDNWRDNAGGTKIYTWYGDNKYTGEYPGNTMTQIQSTNWYYIDADFPETIHIKFQAGTNSGWNSSDIYNVNVSGKYVEFTSDTDNSAFSYTSGDMGYYVYKVDGTYTSMTTTDKNVYKGTIDNQTTTVDTEYYIIPKFIIDDGYAFANRWSFVLRPWDYHQNLEFSNNMTGRNCGFFSNTNSWKTKNISAFFDITFTESNLSYSIEPYFTRILIADYATFSSTYDVDIDGATATYITGVGDNNELTEGSFTNGVPANTGALLYKAGGGTVTFTPAASTPSAATNNKLVAVSSDIDALDQTTSGGNTNYILTNQTVNGEKAIGFYKANSGANGQTKNSVAAGKAYLSLPSSMAVSREFFWLGGEDATSINAIEKVAQNVEGYFNLNGQRIAQPNKGLYIVNGKKVIIK